jgi:hypothetical protein
MELNHSINALLGHLAGGTAAYSAKKYFAPGEKNNHAQKFLKSLEAKGAGGHPGFGVCMNSVASDALAVAELARW